jgi:hypothetical protein
MYRELDINMYILKWHVDPMLGTDHEISNYTAAIAE